MLFNSLAFLVFFPTFLLAYLATRGAVRLWLTLLSSYFFYAWWDWRLLPLLWFQTGLDFFVARALHRMPEHGRRRRLLALSLTTNLCLLGFFKYFHFGVESARGLARLFGFELPEVTLQILLPVGISFYTFQSMSYVIDVYRGEIEPEPSLLRFATAVAMFVHLVAGPIVRARHLLPQLHGDRPFDAEIASAGFEQALWGFFKKMAIADSLAPLVDAQFAAPQLHDGMSLLLAVYFYAVQIYCDFSGYTDIALGLAKILGYDLGVNFDRPYFSTSFSEFWRRWHISLSSWLRDYLYISLGGNRRGNARTYLNLMLTMLIGGLWHGANWTFVAWGGLHGLYLVSERALRPALGRGLRALRVPNGVVKLFAGVLVFHAVCFAWIFFRAQSFHTAAEVILGIATRTQLSFGQVTNKFLVAKAFALIAILFAVETLSFQTAWVGRLRSQPAARLAAGALVVWGIALLATFSGANFIYFQF
ncbi:MAG TPA: MBOAT family O-acyltransferase [Myxococcota bacterium]|nr:MBOAT family O-acyltransferase [Myxococcota bacterium]